ncbi:hypothetical protein [Arthrobacter caoxuetaonis]|uniref:Uncharacterized protein n=1 Tax=Arthrobacter caoxuetaonis TaxID=2886935 RepID=A0A9X1MHI9_9MICC|nr:hypothetical protein [Arthrobacter caoxuetaonis]MCC3299462.1 hypothetical protein [Arthrobacter caoxuetaonis]USQ59046.1 hypothetical protein NF551_18240 [Arthrobacter caoxuetaonis]
MSTPPNSAGNFESQASEACTVIAEGLAPYASPEALESFRAAAEASGDTVDESLPHLQELLRLTVEHLSLRRPGIDTSGALQRLADGEAAPEDIDQLHMNTLTEPIAYVLDGDWDFPASPGLAVALYVQGNPEIDRDVVDAALGKLTAFLNDPEGLQARPAPLRSILIVTDGEVSELGSAEGPGDGFGYKAA